MRAQRWTYLLPCFLDLFYPKASIPPVYLSKTTPASARFNFSVFTNPRTARGLNISTRSYKVKFPVCQTPFCLLSSLQRRESRKFHRCAFLPIPFQLPRVIIWGLSLYCCVNHRCYTAEQRLMTLTSTSSAAMSVLGALVMPHPSHCSPS